MFENFNEQAKKVMVSAQEEARLLGYNFIDSEEILLGIIAQETSSASRLLRAKGVTLDAVRKEVQKIFGCCDGTSVDEIPFTPRVNKILKLASKEAKRFGQDFVSPEHLLWAILEEGSGASVYILSSFNVNLDELRMLLSTEIKNSGEPQSRELSDNSKQLLSPNSSYIRNAKILIIVGFIFLVVNLFVFVYFLLLFKGKM